MFRASLRGIPACLVLALCLPGVHAADESVPQSVYAPGGVLVIVPQAPDPLERYALSELLEHVQAVTGAAPTVQTASEAKKRELAERNLIVIGRIGDNAYLRTLSEKGLFRPNGEAQGYAMHIGAAPSEKGWQAVLCGADPLGVLYAVRDFCHYRLYRDGGRVVLLGANYQLAPRLKARILSESGCNLFGKADYGDHKARLKLNHYFLDWLSEWKATHVLVWWCCQTQYEPLWTDLIEAAHARGLKILRGFVPFRPDHEGAPPGLKAYKAGTRSTEAANCPRDPAARQWYTQRLIDLVTRTPAIDGVVIESPYHDGVCCTCPKCRKDPMPETAMMDALFGTIRKARPDVVLGRCIKRPVPDAASAKRLAADLEPLDDYVDWYYNTYRDRAHRKRWHAIGPKCATYLRTYRSALKGMDVAKEIDFLFNDFRMSAEQNVIAHGFCYRFYGGRYGSFRIEEDRALIEAHPDKKGPLSLALVCEAAFDPFVEGPIRKRKIDRIRAITLPDYPRQTGPKVVTPMTTGGTMPAPSALFRYAWGVRDGSFCGAQVCVDFGNDGKREIVFGSRTTRNLSLLNASDGKVVWNVRIPADYQSVSAYDLDGDGRFEILHSTSGPGRLYVLDGSGKIRKTWDSGDWKLGNSAAILDGDGDGTLDGYFGSRSKHLIRLNMKTFTAIAQRSGWLQCGCHTSAMDVDGDGQWDLFAGCGDDKSMQGTLHRYDPSDLKSLWSFATGQNASSADAVLVDIDGDGRVEIIKSVDNYAQDGGESAVFAFETDGKLLWRVPGLAGEDSPNVRDLDGDGVVEIVGMTFGGEVYCLDPKGRIRWRKDLRPDADDQACAYMTPILCDVDGEAGLEILAMTNGRYFGAKGTGDGRANGILFALSADGEILDRFDLGAPRFWGHAFYCNIDADPTMELVVSGSGGLDVIKTRGIGPNTEHFQRRRSYQRLNVVPWAYEDGYFIYRGTRDGVVNRTDDLVLCKADGGYRPSGRFVTALLGLPPGCVFDRLRYDVHTPPGTRVEVDVLDGKGVVLAKGVRSGQVLTVAKSVHIAFALSTTDASVSPALDAYSLSFRKASP